MPDPAAMQRRFMLQTYPNRGLTLVRGDGVYLWSDAGERYLDLMSNYGVSILGYRHPVLLAALQSQLETLPNLHGSFTSDVRAVVSRDLVRKCGPGYHSVFWSSSGAEAIEAALKFAVLTTGKKKLVACIGGFHGKTLGALSATSGERYRAPYEPLLWNFVRVPYEDLNAMDAAIDAEVAAVIVEPVQGEAGIRIPPADYLKGLRALCDERRVLLILDEVQTGTGRTGRWLASQAADVAADILCLGKGLAGGIPVGATLVSEAVCERIPPGSHSSTFGGNPMACAGVRAVLGVVDDDLLLHIRAMGDLWRAELEAAALTGVQEVRVIGLMIGIQVQPDKRNGLLQRLQQEHLLALPAGNDVIRLLPPYVIEAEHIAEGLRGLRASQFT